MNYIKHLTGFFEKVVADKALNPTHISLYIALFQFWNCNRFKNPISISRDELMRISKISSKATYHKCLRNLHELGYINYQPSFNPFKGSHVIMFSFSEILKPQTKAGRTPLNEPILNSSGEQVLNKSITNSQTCSEQALVSYINNTNITNNLKNTKGLNESQLPQNIGDENISDEVKTVKNKEKKWRKKKKEHNEDLIDTSAENSPVRNHFIVPGLKPEKLNTNFKPTLEEVKLYFSQEKFPDLEAQKFFNYFASIGWLVGGRTPMQNWKAAAQNWMLNTIKFTKESHPLPQTTNKLNITTEKNYAEPL